MTALTAASTYKNKNKKINGGGGSHVHKSKHILQQLNEEVQILKKVELDVICIAMKPNIMEYLQNKWLRRRRSMMKRIGCELNPRGQKRRRLEGYDFTHSIGALYKPLSVYVEEVDGTGDGIESCSQVKEDKSPQSSVIRKVLVILSRALSVL